MVAGDQGDDQSIANDIGHRCQQDHDPLPVRGGVSVPPGDHGPQEPGPSKSRCRPISSQPPTLRAIGRGLAPSRLECKAQAAHCAPPGVSFDRHDPGPQLSGAGPPENGFPAQPVAATVDGSTLDPWLLPGGGHDLDPRRPASRTAARAGSSQPPQVRHGYRARPSLRPGLARTGGLRRRARSAQQLGPDGPGNQVRRSPSSRRSVSISAISSP